MKRPVFHTLGIATALSFSMLLSVTPASAWEGGLSVRLNGKRVSCDYGVWSDIHNFKSGRTIRLTQHKSDPFSFTVARLKSHSSGRTTDEITVRDNHREQWTQVKSANYTLQGIRDDVADCRGWHGLGGNKFTADYTLDL